MGTAFADSTDHYRVTNDISLKWTENVISSARIGTIPDGSGKNGLSVSSGVGKTLAYSNSWCVGFRLYFDSAAGWGGQGVLYICSAANDTPLGVVTVAHDGTINLWAGNQNVLIGNSSSAGFSFHGNTSYYVEIATATSGGSISTNITTTMSLAVNGVTLISGATGNAGVNWSQTLLGTNQANYHQFQDGNIVNGKAWVRDLYIAHDTGAFYGDIGLGADFPDSDVTTTGFSTVGGTGGFFNHVNPQYPDINDDTIYIQASIAGSEAYFLFTSLAVSETIPFVHLGCYHKKDAEGTRTFRLTMNGVEVSPTISPGDDYRYDFFPLDADPNGNPWTIAVFNATSFGVKIDT
jgi:hypothetical protein